MASPALILLQGDPDTWPDPPAGYTAVGVNGAGVITLKQSNGAITYQGQLQPYTVVELPDPTLYPSLMVMVTDSTVGAAAGLGNNPVGGGSYLVPAFSDGTQWLLL